MATDDLIWTRVDVSHWEVLSVEQSGSSISTWLLDPDGETRWLHKDTTIPDNGVEQGEDWSEVVSTQVARLLGLPCAETRLCLRDGRRGSLSRNVRPDGFDLNEGVVALERCVDVVDYFPHTEGVPGVDPSRPAVRRPGHSLRNIQTALRDVLPPTIFEGPEGLSGFDIFAGYLVLDAMIANPDRHEQNWAVLTPQLTSASEQLAPTYDHAGSLGYNLRDDRRERLLMDSAALARWARKGTAHRFEHEPPAASLVDHAVAALAMANARARRYWTLQVNDADVSGIAEALEQQAVPEMSEAASTFAVSLLRINKGRLQDALTSLGS